LYGLSVYKGLLFVLLYMWFERLKGVNSMLSFFKLRLYSSAFIIDGLEAVLDAS
jgi:hypothetical protein